MRPVDASLVEPREPRYASLDVWRGVACLMVVVYHASYYGAEHVDGSAAAAVYGVLGKLWLGVPMFFVISGYCISATSDALRRRPHTAWEYVYRRFRRITPPYWIVLALTALAVALASTLGAAWLFVDANHPIPTSASLTLREWIGNVTLTEKWLYHISGEPPTLLLGPAWSLCYEEQFYAVCGAILFLAPRRFFSGAAVVSMLVVGVMLASALHGTPLPVAGFFFDGRWLLFAAGVLVYASANFTDSPPRRPDRGAITDSSRGVASPSALRHDTPSTIHDRSAVKTYVAGPSVPIDRVASRPGVSRRPAYALLFLGGLAGAVQMLRSSQDFWTEVVVAAAFAATLLALRDIDGAIASRRILQPIAACGRMCYSLYLVHWPITKAISHGLDACGAAGGPWSALALSIPLSLAVSLLLARVFHIQIERRFLNTSMPARATTPVPARAALVEV